MTRSLVVFLALLTFTTTWMPGGAEAGPRDWFGFGKKKTDSTVQQVPTAAAADHQIVYVTKNGHKFHRQGCESLRKSSIPMEYGKAVASYRPCKKCWGHRDTSRQEASLQTLPAPR